MNQRETDDREGEGGISSCNDRECNLSHAHGMKSDELKATMKENHIRYTNPFLSDVENDKVNLWTSQELQSSIIEDNVITNIEHQKFNKSSVSCNVPSDSIEKSKELYIDKNVTECKPPELITCYHEESGFHVKDICVDEGLSHGEKIEIDKKHHELSCNPIIVNEENHDHMIEDDIGIQFSKHEHLISSRVENCDLNAGFFSATKEKLDTNFHVPEHGNDHMNIGHNHDDMIGGNVDTWFLMHDSTKSSSGDVYSDSSFGTKEKADSISLIPEHTHDHTHVNDTEISGQNPSQGKYCKENAIKKSTTDRNTEICCPDHLILTGKGKLDSGSNSLINSSTEQLASCSTISMNQDQIQTSIKVLESSNNGVDQHLSEGPEELERSSETVNTLTEVKMEENDTSDSGDVKPAAIRSPHETDNSEPECVDELWQETHSAPNHQDVASDKGGGELNFSAAGPVSGLITCTGPVASCGSMSHRSDSSNTSVRSFAFPILQVK